MLEPVQDRIVQSVLLYLTVIETPFACNVRVCKIAQKGTPKGGLTKACMTKACTCWQVSMATGRALAAAQRAVERQMKAERSRAAKERGQKRAALAEAERGAEPCLFRSHFSISS